MSDKCEWIDGNLWQCDRRPFKDSLPSIEWNFCPFCGAYLRNRENMTCNSECGMRMKFPDSCKVIHCKHIKPEPTEPLIVKSGDTWVAHWKGIDFLWASSQQLFNVDDSFRICVIDNNNITDWKQFTEIKLTDDIAKLRPMIVCADSTAMICKLYGVLSDKTAISLNDLGNCVRWNTFRLATAKELQEATDG